MLPVSSYSSAGWTSSTSTPPASFGWMKLTRLSDVPRRGTSNSRVNFIHPKDAGGVLVELVQPAHETH